MKTKTTALSKGNPIPKAQRIAPQSSHSFSDLIVRLHKIAGNQAVQRLFKSGVIQAKLRIGQPNDIYEQEADRVADEVMRMPQPGIQLRPG
jgi:hypothetical protein